MMAFAKDLQDSKQSKMISREEFDVSLEPLKTLEFTNAVSTSGGLDSALQRGNQWWATRKISLGGFLWSTWSIRAVSFCFQTRS
jgi:hypothetical protein